MRIRFPDTSRVVIGLIIVGIPLTLANRSEIAFFSMNAGSVMDHYLSQTDIRYGPLPRQKLDIYRPSNVSNSPIVIFWYGGAWVKGSKSQYQFVGTALANSGYLAVLPDYRLYPEARFPAFIEDGALAVRWIQQHAAKFGGDTRNIFLMGHSAGAHIAASIVFDDRYLQAVAGKRETIRGFIGLSGPYGIDQHLRNYYTTIFSDPYTDADWLPFHASEAGIPPVLLFHGTDDWMVSQFQTTEFAKKLQARNVPVILRLYEGRTHQDIVSTFSRFWRFRAPVLKEVQEFLNAKSNGPIT